jgi:hypothetical protein
LCFVGVRHSMVQPSRLERLRFLMVAPLKFSALQPGSIGPNHSLGHNPPVGLYGNTGSQY